MNSHLLSLMLFWKWPVNCGIVLAGGTLLIIFFKRLSPMHTYISMHCIRMTEMTRTALAVPAGRWQAAGPVQRPLDERVQPRSGQVGLWQLRAPAVNTKCMSPCLLAAVHMPFRTGSSFKAIMSTLMRCCLDSGQSTTCCLAGGVLRQLAALLNQLLNPGLSEHSSD